MLKIFKILYYFNAMTKPSLPNKLREMHIHDNFMDTKIFHNKEPFKLEPQYEFHHEDKGMPSFMGNEFFFMKITN